MVDYYTHFPLSIFSQERVRQKFDCRKNLADTILYIPALVNFPELNSETALFRLEADKFAWIHLMSPLAQPCNNIGFYLKQT